MNGQKTDPEDNTLDDAARFVASQMAADTITMIETIWRDAAQRVAAARMIASGVTDWAEAIER